MWEEILLVVVPLGILEGVLMVVVVQEEEDHLAQGVYSVLV